MSFQLPALSYYLGDARGKEDAGMVCIGVPGIDVEEVMNHLTGNHLLFRPSPRPAVVFI